MEQILPDRNISESDPLANVANNSSTLIFRTLQYMPEIDILRNSSQKVLGALRGAFKGFGCPTATKNSLMILIKSCRQKWGQESSWWRNFNQNITYNSPNIL